MTPAFRVDDGEELLERCYCREYLVIRGRVLALDDLVERYEAGTECQYPPIGNCYLLADIAREGIE